MYKYMQIKDSTIEECCNISARSWHPLDASYHENDLSKVTHGPEVHEVILITAVRDHNLRAHPTCK